MSEDSTNQDFYSADEFEDNLIRSYLESQGQPSNRASRRELKQSLRRQKRRTSRQTIREFSKIKADSVDPEFVAEADYLLEFGE